MKDTRAAKRSMVARYRQAFKHAGDICAIIDGKEPNELTAGDMQMLRDLANDLGQCVHEFNAYRNVVLT
jgi:hypothetical protein